MQEFSFQNFGFEAYAVTGYMGDEKHVVIPDRYGNYPVMVVGDNVFKGHPEIESITFPDAVTDLGEFVFDGCTNLRTIKLPSQLTNLWGATFARSGLEEVEFPALVQTIPPYAFKDCKKLKRIICGINMKKIYAWAFDGCDELSEIVHGIGVDISPLAFEKNEQQK